LILCLAAVLGDTVNYHIGHILRSKIVNHEDIRFVKKKHLDSTHIFCEKYGVKAIILASFIPIIRTFAHFVAGVGIMPYSKFICYNVICGFGWVSSFLLGEYFFGNLSAVKDNLSFVILGIIFVSLISGVITYIQSKHDSNKEIIN
jgi:membrane-associated protein